MDGTARFSSEDDLGGVEWEVGLLLHDRYGMQFMVPFDTNSISLHSKTHDP